MPVPIPTQNGPQTRVPTPREVLGHIRSQVFELSRTTNVVEAMQEILDDFDEIQPPGAIVLTAPSGAGKTTACKQLLYSNPEYWETVDGQQKLVRPVVFVTVPRSAKPRDTAARVARSLGIAGYRKMTEKTLTDAIIDAIEAQQVKVIIIDEAHHMNINRVNTADDVRHLFKDISNNVPICYIFAGIESAEDVVTGDDQLDSRFSSHLKIERFSLKSYADLREFRSLIQSIDSNSLLEYSDLDNLEMVARLFVASKGILRTLLRLVGYGAKYAVEDNSRIILPSHLAKAYERHGSPSSYDQWNPFSVPPAQLLKSDLLKRTILVK